MPKKRFSLRLDSELADRLAEMCRDRDISKGQLVETEMIEIEWNVCRLVEDAKRESKGVLLLLSEEGERALEKISSETGATKSEVLRQAIRSSYLD